VLKFDLAMKRIVVLFFLLLTSLFTYSQVKTVMFDSKEQVTQDSSLAATYAVYGKLAGDSVYTFKKFDFDGILLTSGSFKDDSLQVPHGQFIYYNWITPENNPVSTYGNSGFEINGKERYIEVRGSFKDGKRTGRWITFYPDGKMKQILTFTQGILHGGYQSFDHSGKVLVSGLYSSGKRNGIWTLDGGKQENEYVNDQLISSLRGKQLREKQEQRKNTNQGGKF
jgi:antitoxin component YwqK of YwqJK toxin-antitoxin module